jgi:hypothetical protein
VFHEANIPYGSLEIDSLNLSNAELSVLFPMEEVNVFWMKLKAKRRDKQNENVGNMAGKGFEEQSIIF